LRNNKTKTLQTQFEPHPYSQERRRVPRGLFVQHGMFLFVFCYLIASRRPPGRAVLQLALDGRHRQTYRDRHTDRQTQAKQTRSQNRSHIAPTSTSCRLQIDFKSTKWASCARKSSKKTIKSIPTHFHIIITFILQSDFVAMRVHVDPWG
jgi:hypothetical protein